MNGICQTHSGIAWNLLDPDPESVRIEDIAHALSNQCRYNGHCKEFYSVAEHSVRVASCLPPKHQLAGLLHDAAEAYIGDIVRPLKPLLRDYRAIEEATTRAVLDGLGLSDLQVNHEVVKYADRSIILATEGRDLMDITQWEIWAPDLYHDKFVESALDEVIVPWSNHEARRRFMDAYMYQTSMPEGSHI